MVEQHAIAGVHAIALAVIDSDPVGIELGNSIGATWIKRRGLLLWDLLNQAVELTRAGLVNTGFVGKPQDPNRLQNPQGTQSITIGGIGLSKLTAT